MNISTVLGDTSNGVAVLAFVFHMASRIKARTYFGLMSIALALALFGDVTGRSTRNAVIDSALLAWMAYQWWKSGGDDDSKRRLRSELKPFVPVRRSAPVEG